MKVDFTRPEKTIRSELVSLLAVALVPFGIMSVFPFRAVGYSCKDNVQPSKSFASIVFLSEEEEIEAIGRARSAWQTAELGVKGPEIDLSMEILPEIDTTAVLDNPIVHVRNRLSSASLGNVPLKLPSLAAEAPEKVEIAPIVSEKFFSDEDLMKLK